MKKIVAIVSVILFVLTSCESGDIIGGRYYGTFHNLMNDEREAGSISFTYCSDTMKQHRARSVTCES